MVPSKETSLSGQPTPPGEQQGEHRLPAARAEAKAGADDITPPPPRDGGIRLTPRAALALLEWVLAEE